jgi:HlyD family secretion protein
VAAAEARLRETQGRLEDPELEFCRRESARMEELFQQGNVSHSERDAAAQALAAVQFRIQQVRNSIPVLEAAILEARAALESAQASLERSQTAFEEATIRSSIDGIVLVRPKEVGDGVSSILTAGGNATEILTLGDLSVMFVEARVDEVDLGRIEVSMEARITVDAHRGVELKGVVDRIAPAGSVDNNGIVTFEVRLTVEDPQGLLRPDMTANAKLIRNRRAAVLTLPQRTLWRDDVGSWYVSKVVGEGELARLEDTPVELGLSDGLVTEITSGLADGDVVLLPENRTR